MDERQKLNAGNAAMIVLFLLGLGGVGYMVWDFVSHGDITNVPVVVLVVAAWGLFYLLYQVFGGEAPKNLFGKELPTGSSAEDRAARRRSYLVDSTLFAAGMSVLSLLAYFFVGPDSADLLPPFLQGAAGVVVGLIIEFVLLWVVFYVFTRWASEAEARSVERKLARLEASGS